MPSILDNTPVLNFMTLVPKVTDPMGVYWEQPARYAIGLYSDGYVVMCKKAFNELSDYSHSNPSGVYSGKMWKAQRDEGWYLCWYDNMKDVPNIYEINRRPIILKEMMDLLTE